MIVAFPQSIDPATPARQRDLVASVWHRARPGPRLPPRRRPGVRRPRLRDLARRQPRCVLAVNDVVRERLVGSQLHPDVWPAGADPRSGGYRGALADVAGDKYSYRDLDDFTDLHQADAAERAAGGEGDARRRPARADLSSSTRRSGSPPRACGPRRCCRCWPARNTTAPGGLIEIGGRGLLVDPSGEFTSARQIGDVIVGAVERRPRRSTCATASTSRAATRRRRAISTTSRPGNPTGRGGAPAPSRSRCRCARASRSPTFGQAVDAALAGLRPGDSRPT